MTGQSFNDHDRQRAAMDGQQRMTFGTAPDVPPSGSSIPATVFFLFLAGLSAAGYYWFFYPKDHAPSDEPGQTASASKPAGQGATELAAKTQPADDRPEDSAPAITDDAATQPAVDASLPADLSDLRALVRKTPATAPAEDHATDPADPDDDRPESHSDSEASADPLAKAEPEPEPTMVTVRSGEGVMRRLRLEMTMVSSSGGTAVINGKMYKPGSMVGQLKLLRIGNGWVLLRKGNTIYRVYR